MPAMPSSATVWLDPGVELDTKFFSYPDLAARIRDLLDAPG